jgi:GAF domain-containing protein
VSSCQRTIVQAFTDSEVALAETFADQAVIAIENVSSSAAGNSLNRLSSRLPPPTFSK